MRNVKINLFEVGDIFLTVNNINPATRFKGTWELIAKGRTLVGVDPNDSDFNTVQKIGGSKFLQKHFHDIRWGNENGSGVTVSSSGTGTQVLNISSWNWNYNTGNQKGSGSNLYTNVEGTGNSGNLQPYFTCYIWCRTA